MLSVYLMSQWHLIFTFRLQYDTVSATENVITKTIKKNKKHYKWRTMWHSTQTLPRHSLLSKCHTASQYTNKCNFIYNCKKSTVVPAPSCTELTNAQWHYMTISHTLFHPNQSRNTKIMGTNSFIFVSKVSLSLHQFPWKSELLDSILLRTPIPNFMRTW